MSDSKGKSVIKTMFSITGIIVIVKLLGFVKETITAGVFGATIETDMINVAHSFVHNIKYVLIPLLSTSFISVYIYTKEKSEDDARRFALDTVKVFCVILIPLILLLELCSPWVARIIAPSYTAEQTAVVASYLRLFLPLILTFLLIGVFSAVLNANKRFVATQLEGGIQSVIIILCILLFRRTLGIRTIALAFVLFSVFNAVFFGALAWPYCARSSRHPFKTSAIRSMLRMCGPLLIGYSVVYVNELVAKMLVSGLDAGSVTAINYGSILSNLITTFIAAFASILFPYVTDSISAGLNKEAADMTGNAALVMAALFLPVTIVFALCAEDVVSVVFGHGAFDARAVHMTARALIGYSLTFVPMVMNEIFSRFQYGYQASKRPMINSTIGILVNIGLSILLCPRFGVLGVAFASSMSVVICGTLNMITARRHNTDLNYRLLLKWLPLLLAAGAVCALVCLGGNRILAEWRPLLRLAVTGVSAVLLYALTALPLVLRMVPLFVVRRTKGNAKDNEE